MKTAVEFIVEQLDCLNRERKEKIIDAETYFKNKKALIEQVTPNCRQQCSHCGAKCFGGGVCYE